VTEYHDDGSGFAVGSRPVPALAGGPDGRPGDGNAADDAGSLLPAQDAYLRLIKEVSARAGPESWMARGACHRSDPELFFPIGAPGSAAEQIQIIYAKAVCACCQVGRECLAYALRTTPHGIWGGTTREERIAIRARAVARSSRQGQS
jgi:WhiB family transcriptional regulator, redox-sensing transcriptional regulator